MPSRPTQRASCRPCRRRAHAAEPVAAADRREQVPPVQAAREGEPDVLEHVQRRMARARRRTAPGRARPTSWRRRRRSAKTGWPIGPAARSRCWTRRVTGRSITCVRPRMHRIGATSSSSRCWTMCMTKSFSASASIGEISAAAAAGDAPTGRPPGASPISAQRAAARGGPPASAGRRPSVTSPSSRIGPGSKVHGRRGHRRAIVAHPAPRGADASPLTGDHRPVLQRLLDLLVAPACLACRAPVPAGNPLCRGCRAGLAWLPADRCPRCGLPSPCGTPCPARAAAFARAWAPVAYDGDRARAGARAEAPRPDRGGRPDGRADRGRRAAGPPAPAHARPGAGHPRRRRRRGFDQAERIAAALGRRVALPVARCLDRGGRCAAAGRRRPRPAPPTGGARSPSPRRFRSAPSSSTTCTPRAPRWTRARGCCGRLVRARSVR